jgi:hypothetical protein
LSHRSDPVPAAIENRVGKVAGVSLDARGALITGD